jgi:hypothetical protein
MTKTMTNGWADIFATSAKSLLLVVFTEVRPTSWSSSASNVIRSWIAGVDYDLTTLFGASNDTDGHDEDDEDYDPNPEVDSYDDDCFYIIVNDNYVPIDPNDVEDYNTITIPVKAEKYESK